MLKKFAYRLFPSIVLMFALYHQSYAITIEIQPQEVIPGDLFLLKVVTDNTPFADLSAVFNGRNVVLFQYTDNHFIAFIPVDIETLPDKYPVTVTSGKEVNTIHIKVKSYSFKTQKITLPEDKVILKPDDLKRAEKEAELMNSVLSQTTERAWDGDFTVPTDTPVSEPFGTKRIMNEKKTSVHRGIDYKGKTGTPVKAVNAGKVVLKEDLFFGGNTVVLDHGMGLFSIYMHLSEFSVEENESISKGQVIGLVGMSGRATGPHLHFGFKLQGVSVNPQSLFNLNL